MFAQRQAARPIPIPKGDLRQLATQLYDWISKRLPNRPRSIVPMLKGRGPDGYLPTPFTLDYTEVDGSAVKTIPVYVDVGGTGITPQRRFVSGGEVRARGYEGGRASKIHLAIRLFDQSADDFVSPRNRNRIIGELFSVLIHEYTHLRDILRTHSKDEETDSIPESYYNKPTEVRAFMQQIADEVLETAWEAIKTSEGWITVRQIVTVGLERSLTWDRVRPYLKGSNRSRVLSGVYRAVEDEYMVLMKRYEKMARRLGLGFDPPAGYPSRRVAHMASVIAERYLA